jgi:O-antigen ligase
VERTIFREIVYDWLGEAGFLRLNAWGYVAILLLTIAIPACRLRLQRFRSVWLVTVAYGATIVVSTALNVQGATEARHLEAVLIPLTIASLGTCLPSIFDADDYELLFRGLIGLFAVSAIASLWLVVADRANVFGYPVQVPPDGRGGRLSASGLFVQRNTIGSFLQYIPALIVYLLWYRPTGSQPHPPARLRTWLDIGALVLISAHLLLTFSRSAHIVALLSLLPLLVGLWRTRARDAYAVAALVLAGVALALAAVPEFRDYARLGLMPRGRRSIWLGVLRQAVEQPFFGFGLLNLEFRAPARTHTPHSAYLAQFAFFGIVGLALFLGVVAAFGRLVLQNLRSGDGRRPWPIVMVVCGALLQGLAEYIVTFPVFFSNSMFWICLGLAAREPEGTCLLRS